MSFSSHTSRYLSHVDWALIFSTCAIPLCGLIVLYSAGYDPESEGVSIDWLGLTIQSSAFLKQLVFLGAGSLVLLLAASIPTSFFFRIAPFAYFGGIALLTAVLQFGYVSNGARRWLSIGGFNLQPAELMKLGLVLMLARYLARRPPPPGGYRVTEMIVPALLVFAPMALIAKQPDLGTALAVGAVGVGMILFMGVHLRTLLTIVTILAVMAVPAWQFLHDYQKRRVTVLFNPDADPLGSGYHIIQSKIAVGSGALFGRGYFKGTQSQLEFLPEHTTDFVFSVLAEEWGFVGAVVVLALYVLWIYRLLRVAAKARDLHSTLLVTGIISIIFFHTIINIGMVVGLFPVVGIPLPLFSYGGSSVMTTMAALGIVLGVSLRRFQFANK